MTLSDWASIASILSSAAVAVTLLFLALQIRQAEKNQRAMMQQGRADRISTQALQVASDPTLSRLFNKGMQRPAELTREELDQFVVLTRALFISAEDSYLQNRAGMLDEASYESQIAGIKYMMGAWPGLRIAWRYMSPQYNEGFRAFMNAMVDHARGPPADRMAEWTTLVHQVAGEAQPARQTE